MLTLSKSDVPVIETPRLTLRGHEVADFADCARMWADPLVTRFIGGKPSTSSESWRRLLGYRGHWALMGFGYWAVEEKASGDYVGDVGFADFKRDLEPSIVGLPEVGWVLSSPLHGKGYATEALKAALAWGERTAGFTKTVCLIAPENAASLRVAAKGGYREIQATTYLGQPTLLLERKS